MSNQKSNLGRPVIHIDLTKSEHDELVEQLEEDPLPPETVRTVREALGLSQEDFGEKVGAARRTVQDWEAGARNCRGPARMLVLKVASKIKPVEAASA